MLSTTSPPPQKRKKLLYDLIALVLCLSFLIPQVVALCAPFYVEPK
jgi:hypothetical protein